MLGFLSSHKLIPFNLFQQLLIGNDTYIKKCVWDKITDTDKLSVMVKDLAVEIWGEKLCATLSLSGGVSPKTPGAERKEAAPPGAVEAILGEHYCFIDM